VVTDWYDNEALFVSQLRTGHAFAEYVAAQIRRHGLFARVTPIAIRNDIADRHRLADEHDLTIGRHREVRIDVKSRNLRFSNVADYSYPTAFVDSVSGWTAKSTKPSAIVVVSQVTGAMLVVPRSTESLWIVRRRTDRLRCIDDEFFEVPTSLLRPFGEFVQWLKAVEVSTARVPWG
jgi:hypothetical protein